MADLLRDIHEANRVVRGDTIGDDLVVWVLGSFLHFGRPTHLHIIFQSGEVHEYDDYQKPKRTSERL
jgi:hypothetical protein